MVRPRLLDLFCKAGGAGMGYYRAGFDVVGVDIEPQKRHPSQGLFGIEEMSFVQADALEYVASHGHEFDAIHASPPCQAFCALKSMPNAKQHPDLIEPTRQALQQTGKPYVIENVPGAPLVDPVVLCGTMFRLRTDCGAELRRHRLFETNWSLVRALKCRHYATEWPCTISVHGHSGGSSRRDSTIHANRTICVNGTGLPLSGGRVISVHGDHPRDPAIAKANRVISVAGHTPWNNMPKSKRTITVTGSTPQQNVERNVRRESFPVSSARVAMGIDWMTMAELSQAIPPAYTEFIGRQLINFV